MVFTSKRDRVCKSGVRSALVALILVIFLGLLCWKQTNVFAEDKVFLPDETSDLEVKRGEDYCTLVTCTPYGVNSHRLLVRGHRVPYDENDEAKEALNSMVGPFTNYAMWIFGSLAVVALFAVVVMKRSRDRQQHERLKRQYCYTSKND